MEKPSFRNLRIPLSTYRVQMNHNFRFTDAAAIIPYLSDLGITDLYSSPYFTACSGSLHGYDITDPTQLSPEIGTSEEYELLINTMRQYDMGQILDIVPNHMCIDHTNKYWMDLLENGPASNNAGFFDIDWDPVKKELRGKVLLPLLGDQYGIVLEKKDIQLFFENGSFFVRVYEERLPILPETYADILSFRIEELEKITAAAENYNEMMSIITSAGKLPTYLETDPLLIEERYREKEIIKKRLNELYTNDPVMSEFIDRNVGFYNGTQGEPKSFDLLDNLLSKQVYRLSYWQVATEEINYRRFFDINKLAAISVEKPEVFEATHRLIFDLIEQGKVTGLRVDHPDGLYNPSEYLDRLQRRCFEIAMKSHVDKVKEDVDLPYGVKYIESVISERYEEALQLQKDFKPFYIVGEKILGKGEIMPVEWRLFSTTGYVFLNSLTGVFVDGQNSKAFDALYRKFIRTRSDFQDVVYTNKKLVMETAMSSEVNTLGHQLNLITEKNRLTRDFTLNSLIKAIVEVIACFPVYRTYINGPEVRERDAHYIELAVSRALRKNPVMNESIFYFMKTVLLLGFGPDMTEDERSSWLNFTMRFQQTTGPVTAKGVEDTAFYVYNKLVSLNEVGGNPDRFGTPLDTFHGQNLERLKNWPFALIASSTHDTKRSEDVRARISVLSEIPGEWSRHIILWAKVNGKKKVLVNNRQVPDRNEEYLLYQTLAGTWPLGELTAEEYEAYKRRIKEYMGKAVKEAKVNTSWINPDRVYEEALDAFVDEVLDRGEPNAFLDDFLPFQERIALCGMHNSASQTLLKICSPGVPDFYQGMELFNFSLVDPDNRQPVDYALRIRMLAGIKDDMARKHQPFFAKELTSSMKDGRIKLYITYRALKLRKELRQVFEQGEYIPLETAGIRSGHVIAFARRLLNSMIVVAVPRFLAKILLLPDSPFDAIWEDTRIVLPAGAGEARYTHIFTGEVVAGSGNTISCRDIFHNFPVALLEKT